jgi:hypothetical protein
MTIEEFELKRIEWLKNWSTKYRLLDIDFETFMLMNGITKDMFVKLNEEFLKIKK